LRGGRGGGGRSWGLGGCWSAHSGPVRIAPDGVAGEGFGDLEPGHGHKGAEGVVFLDPAAASDHGPGVPSNDTEASRGGRRVGGRPEGPPVVPLRGGSIVEGGVRGQRHGGRWIGARPSPGGHRTGMIGAAQQAEGGRGDIGVICAGAAQNPVSHRRFATSRQLAIDLLIPEIVEIVVRGGRTSC